MNRWLRRRWGDGPTRLGSVIEIDEGLRREESRVSS
jgi:hypothetical protein